MMPTKKPEQPPLIAVPPAQRATRRGPRVVPRWTVTTRCLDCTFTRTAIVEAMDAHTAKGWARSQCPPPTQEHRHRYVSAAGPA